MIKIIIDFKNKSNNELFTGRKNGVKGREFFKVKSADKYIIKASDKQLITSSYFLGLLGEELHKFGTPKEILSHIDMSNLSSNSREECIRAVKRGFATRSLI